MRCKRRKTILRGENRHKGLKLERQANFEQARLVGTRLWHMTQNDAYLIHTSTWSHLDQILEVSLNHFLVAACEQKWGTWMDETSFIETDWMKEEGNATRVRIWEEWRKLHLINKSQWVGQGEDMDQSEYIKRGGWPMKFSKTKILTNQSDRV